MKSNKNNECDDDMCECEQVVTPMGVNSILAAAGIYRLEGSIQGGSLRVLTDELLLKHLEVGFNRTIRLYVNSPGGIASEAWPFVDLLDYVQVPITTIGTGEVGSFGALIVAAGTKGMRFATPNTSIMVHGFSAGIDGSYADLKAQMQHMEQEHQRSIAFWQKHSKYKSRSMIEKFLVPQTDLWMTPKDAMTHGIIDGIWK